MITAYIHKSPFDSTNGGISSRVSIVHIWDPDNESLDDLHNHEGHYILKLCRKVLANGRGNVHLYLEPIAFPDRGKWMMGGNFAWNSDSRFPNQYPIPIHDRQELVRKVN